MSKELVLTLPIPPSVNNYLNYKVQRAKNGRFFVHPYKSEKTIEYEKQVIPIIKNEIKKQKWDILDKNRYVIVDATIYFPSHGMDANNNWKVPLDCFKEAGIYYDDSKVVEGVKRIYIDKNNPRVEYRIYDSGFIGIFDNEDHLYSFIENNCLKCKKNHNRCSTMTKAIENRLTGEINLEYNQCIVIK